MRRRRALALAAAGMGFVAGCSGASQTADDGTTSTPASTGGTAETTRANPNTVFVSPDGSVANDGTEAAPYRSIQRALTEAEPGDTVYVKPGEYAERIEPPRGGEPDAPITITGPPDAVLKSDPEAYNVVIIRHSHVHVTGLTIDGLENPDAPDDVESYSRAQLVQLRPPVSTDAYLEDVVVSPHRIGNTQKSLVSVERSKHVEVGPFRVIGPAGTKYLLTDEHGHNGEFVYIGTSPSNLGTDWHPWTAYDETSDVHVHHIDNSEGYGHSELANTKLGTRGVLVEYCTDGGGSQNTEDTPAASVRFQSFDATVRWCDLRNGKGRGVEVGSYKARDAQDESAEPSAIERRGGTDNAVYGNRLSGFDDAAVAYPVERQTQADQRYVCGNDVDGETDGDPTGACPADVPDGDGVGHRGGESPRREEN